MAPIDRRIGLLFVAFVALLAIALSRALYLGTLKAGTLRADAATQQVTTVPVPAMRGAISDAHGTELAISETADNVVADPFLIKKKNRLGAARRLAPLLGVPQPRVLTDLSEQRGYVYLAFDLPTAQAKSVTRLEIPGISLVPTVTRSYPQNSLASQVIGWVGDDDQGLSGIEYRYNTILSGRNGERRVVSDALGQSISINEIHSAVPGNAIKLTLDSALQAEVE